jgi:hypothetical protein
MSTKTIYKRIALVAVAALGAGLLSVAPANAATARTATGAVTSTFAATTVGTLGTVTLSAPLEGDEDDTLSVSSITGPVGGDVTFATIGGVNIDDVVITVGDGATNLVNDVTGEDTTTGVITGSVSRPGTYVITLAGGAVITHTATGQANSIAPLVADGLAETAANSTNKTAANGVAGVFNTVTVGVVSGSGVTLKGTNTVGTAGRRTLVTVTGGTFTSGTGMTIAENKLSAVSNVANQTFATNPAGALIVNTPTVGTVTVSSFLETSNAGIFSATADQTVTITVNATASNNVVSPTGSLAKMGAIAAIKANDGTDDVISANNSSTATVQAANISVTVRDASLNVIDGLAVNAVITGPGLLGITADAAVGNTAGTLRVAALAAAAGNDTFNVSVWPDKTGSGTSTVTISAGTTVIATKTISWYGAAKTLTAGAITPHVLVSGANADAIYVLAKDDKGTTVPLTTPTALSSDSTVISSTLSSCDDASAAQIALGVPTGARVCDISSFKVGTATLTISPASTTTNSPTIALRVTKSTIASIALSTNKATYAPGEKITLSLTAKDEDGHLIGAGAYDIVNGESTVSQSAQGTPFATGNATINAGVATTSYFAPLIAGPVTFTVKTKAAAPLATAAQGLTLTATANVVAPASVDSANIAALTTLVNSLIAKINALNKLVIKIQKKVRA